MVEFCTPKQITHYRNGRIADWEDWAFGNKKISENEELIINKYINGEWAYLPILTYSSEGRMYLLDGWHRLIARIKSGNNLLEIRDLSKEEIRYDVGAALKPYCMESDNWLHSDVQRLAHIELVRSITEECPFLDNTVTEIRCCKALDHVPHNLGYNNDISTITHVKILREWYRILKDGGKCTVILQYTPGICAAHVAGNLEHFDFIRMIHGVQDKDWNYKYLPMDERLGKHLFELAGFNNILATNYYYDGERIDVDSLHIVITGEKNGPIRDK